MPHKPIDEMNVDILSVCQNSILNFITHYKGTAIEGNKTHVPYCSKEP